MRVLFLMMIFLAQPLFAEEYCTQTVDAQTSPEVSDDMIISEDISIVRNGFSNDAKDEFIFTDGSGSSVYVQMEEAPSKKTIPKGMKFYVVSNIVYGFNNQILLNSETGNTKLTLNCRIPKHSGQGCNWAKIHRIFSSKIDIPLQCQEYKILPATLEFESDRASNSSTEI